MAVQKNYMEKQDIYIQHILKSKREQSNGVDKPAFLMLFSLRKKGFEAEAVHYVWRGAGPRSLWSTE